MSYVHMFGRRLLHVIPVVFGVTLIVFWLIHLVPGDPARTALGLHATAKGIAQLHREWGLDNPLPTQYVNYLGRLIHGDLGTSFHFQEPVAKLIGERLPITIWLVVYSAVLIVLISAPLAILAASKPGALRDRVVTIFSVTGLGIPSFWLGLLLIQWVAIESGALPAGGFGEGFAGHLESMFLPSVTIALGIVPLVIRSLRAEILKVSDADYVITARAKGLSERRIRRMHVFRNALPPAVTILAVNIGFLVGGTVVVEEVFGLGGVGALMLSGINARDFPIVQGVTLFFAFAVIITNFVGEMIQAALDPRIESS